MAHTKIYREAAAKLQASCPYSRCYWDQWDYFHLDLIRTVTKPSKKKNKKKDTYNDVIMMFDTESSKDHKPANRSDICENHIVIWTLSIRAYHYNIVTLYGRRPDELAVCIKRVHESMKGLISVFYCHNLGWDWTFERQFIMAEIGTPKNQLNVKPYYPVYIEFKNGIILKDSLILAQRKLEKWADDLQVEHRKAVGSWDYDKIRHQDPKLTSYTDDEMMYAEYDTLAGVECIDATMETLKAKIYTIPYTCTGIVRNETRKRGKKNRARQHYLKVVPGWESQQKSEMLYHGGYTHGNRYAVGWVNPAECQDFASRYPADILLNSFPEHKFCKYDKPMTLEKVLEWSEKYAMKFLFSAKNIRLKDPAFPMPMVQSYKCVHKSGEIEDNGRVLSADYISIWWCEQDLILFDRYYKYDQCWITNLEYSLKEYLPRWFTDLVYELFKDKTMLKGGDPVLYAIRKAMLNSMYGNLVQKPVKITIKEDYQTGEYIPDENFNEEKEYEKHIKNFNSINVYDNGCWITAYAQRELFELAECIDYEHGGIWLYSDTDSIYATKWDQKKLDEHNKKVIARLEERGYPGIEHEGKIYYPGVAEFDGSYSEFKCCGAKRYACRYSNDKRNKKEDRGKLKLTVAGVPKKGGAKCLKDDINNFRPGFIFDGEITGKKQHTHFYNPIHTDKYGNLIGDSIDLSPCDYLLDDIFNNAKKLQEYLDGDYEEVLIQVFEED